MRPLAYASMVCALGMLVAPGSLRAASTSVPLFTNEAYPGGWGPGVTTTVTLPDAATMKTFNSMSITMDMACPSSGCPPWDFVANLYVCADANAPTSDTCTTEIARWVTPYGKAGKWTTDISPMLAELQRGGKQAFCFWTPQAYTLNVTLTLGSAQQGTAPDRAIALFQGGDLDSGYNAAHKPKTLHFDKKPTKAQLFTLVTGHGWGDNAEDCAEFCNIAHHFGIGGQDYKVDFPDAGSATGCQDLVNQGVVPDQAGTWQYGRDGWCPGWDVHPWIVDVTDSLMDGNNTMTYEALYNGAVYDPTPVSNPPQNAIGPTIALSSYLVVWDAPVAVVDPNTMGQNPNSGVNLPGTQPETPSPVDAGIENNVMQTRAGCNALDTSMFAWLLPIWLLSRRREK